MKETMQEHHCLRCPWAVTHPLLQRYHDTEWGVPVHEDRLLLEMLTLEGAQAGLSWLTILKKREHYRRAFAQFDVQTVAAFDTATRESLMADPGIVRHRGKITAAVANAHAVLAIQHEFGSFDAYIWQFVGGTPLRASEKPLAHAKSVEMSDALKRRGFRFVGPTICLAFMQAVGMVNDHIPECFRATMSPNCG